MKTLEVKRNDILKSVYFITALTQNLHSASMQGALSSKGDLMGGIFDRWINTVTESLILNNIILPDISDVDHVKIICDFYLYDPKTVGIAPDVIGIKVNECVIPFVVFNDKWTVVENMPQIEVKTFKKPQKMISLRDQSYDGKILVMAESEFRVDYLLPLFSPDIFTESTYQNLHMDDSVFIVSNQDDRIHQMPKVDLSNDSLGTVSLLKITTAKEFMESSTFCEGNVSVQYFKAVEEKKRGPRGELIDKPISEYCDLTEWGLYRFNSNWYEGITESGIPYYTKKSKNGNLEFLYRTLDVSFENISAIKLLKKSTNSMYLKVDSDASINGHKLYAGKVYKIDFQILDRSSNKGEEYFMQKNLVQYVPDYEKELKNTLKKIINGGN